MKKSERTKESIINRIENDEIACKQLEKYYEKQALLAARNFDYSDTLQRNYFLPYIKGVKSGLPFLKHSTFATVEYIFSNEKKRLSTFIRILLYSERGQRFLKNNDNEMNSQWPLLLDVAKLICLKEQA